jgi:hypothetical protein
MLTADDDDFDDQFDPLMVPDLETTTSQTEKQASSEEQVRMAREAFAHFHGRDVESVGELEVASSAAGIAGWAASQKAVATM